MSLALQPRPACRRPHQHVLRLVREQRLRRQHVLDLAGADAVRQRAEGAVGRGVRVAADDRHAGQRGALLRADHVDDALALVVHLELGDAEAVAVGVERVDLQARDRVGDAVRAVGGRHVVVAHRQVRRQAPDLAAGQLEPLEGLRAGHLVHQVAVDVEHRGAVVLGVDDVLVPDLVVQRASHGRPWREKSQSRHFRTCRPTRPAPARPRDGESHRKASVRAKKEGGDCPLR